MTQLRDYGDGIYGVEQKLVRAFLVVGERRALLLDTCAIPFDLPAIVRAVTGLPLTVALTHGDGEPGAGGRSPLPPG